MNQKTDPQLGHIPDFFDSKPAHYSPRPRDSERMFILDDLVVEGVQ